MTTAAVLVPPESDTVKFAAEPSATVDRPVTAAVRSSSSSIVPVAVGTARLTPGGNVVPVIVTVSVSSASVKASSVVGTVRVPEVSPAPIVKVPAVTAV